MHVDPSVSHLGRFWGEHWLGILTSGVVLLLISPIVTFPGGNPKTLWWVCAGCCIAASFFLYWAFYVLIGSMGTAPSVSSPPTPQLDGSRPKSSSSARPDLLLKAGPAIAADSRNPFGGSFWYATVVVDKWVNVPVAIQLYLQCTNRSGQPFRFGSFAVENRSETGEWQQMPHLIVNDDHHLYMTSNFQCAKRMRPNRLFTDAVANKDIPVGETVGGWIILGFPKQPFSKDYRLRFRDTSDNEYTQKILMPLGTVADTSKEEWQSLVVVQCDVDISKNVFALDLP